MLPAVGRYDQAPTTSGDGGEGSRYGRGLHSVESNPTAAEKQRSQVSFAGSAGSYEFTLANRFAASLPGRNIVLPPKHLVKLHYLAPESELGIRLQVNPVL